MKPQKIKECFGDQGGSVLCGKPADECATCDLFDRCHKVTVAVALQGINSDLGLVTQNGLRLGWLKCYKELDRLDPGDSTESDPEVPDSN